MHQGIWPSETLPESTPDSPKNTREGFTLRNMLLQQATRQKLDRVMDGDDKTSVLEENYATLLALDETGFDAQTIALALVEGNLERIERQDDTTWKLTPGREWNFHVLLNTGEVPSIHIFSKDNSLGYSGRAMSNQILARWFDVSPDSLALAA